MREACGVPPIEAAAVVLGSRTSLSEELCSAQELQIRGIFWGALPVVGTYNIALVRAWESFASRNSPLGPYTRQNRPGSRGQSFRHARTSSWGRTGSGEVR